MDANLEGDLGWMLGVVFRAYVKASDHALRDVPGGPRGYLGSDRTGLTSLIDDLERRDLGARRPDPADRRSRLVVATTEGRATWQRLQDELRRVEAHVLSPLPAADAASFLALLSQLACQAQSLDPLTNLCEVAEQVKAG